MARASLQIEQTLKSVPPSGLSSITYPRKMELNSDVSGMYHKRKSFMKIFDAFAFIVTRHLARPAAPVPVQTPTVRGILKGNTAIGCGIAACLTESAFPMVAIPGSWEMLRKFRSEGDRGLSSDVDPEDFNRFVERGSKWNYTIVPWED
jgi:hypothetical protein